MSSCSTCWLTRCFTRKVEDVPITFNFDEQQLALTKEEVKRQFATAMAAASAPPPLPGAAALMALQGGSAASRAGALPPRQPVVEAALLCPAGLGLCVLAAPGLVDPLLESELVATDPAGHEVAWPLARLERPLQLVLAPNAGAARVALWFPAAALEPGASLRLSWRDAATGGLRATAPLLSVSPMAANHVGALHQGPTDPSASALGAGPSGGAALLPLVAPSGGAPRSSYNKAYFCEARCAAVSAAGLEVCICATGDGSLGPLQQPEASTLRVALPSGSEMQFAALGFVPVAPPPPDPAALQPVTAASPDGDRLHGVLRFPLRAAVRGGTLSLCFGAEDYEPAELFVLDDALIAHYAIHHLVQLSPAH